ncbi:hypothetical protein KKG71_05210 [Patescibacteria group bacterium]|nr:hypothetical protein [Patescibacteria group bacterium]
MKTNKKHLIILIILLIFFSLIALSNYKSIKGQLYFEQNMNQIELNYLPAGNYMETGYDKPLNQSCWDPDGDSVYNSGTSEYREKYSILGSPDKRRVERDYCEAGNAKFVNEWICNNNDQLQKRRIQCAYNEFCYEGACTNCMDEDFGKDSTNPSETKIFNEITKTIESSKDICVDIKQLKEFYCDQTGKKQWELITCRHKCNNGGCFPEWSKITPSQVEAGKSVIIELFLPHKTITSEYWNANYSKTVNLNPKHITIFSPEQVTDPRTGSKIMKQYFLKINDNGLNGDKKAGDNIYTTTFSDTLVDGEYGVTSIFENGGAQSTPDKGVLFGSTSQPRFNVSKSFQNYAGAKCLEVIKGHNDKSKDRINLVFTATGYENIEMIKYIIELLVEKKQFNPFAKQLSLFSQPPFDNNINKFNLWMVDKVAPPMAKNQTNYYEGSQQLSANCVLPNKYTVNFINDNQFYTHASGKNAYIGHSISYPKGMSFSNYLKSYKDNLTKFGAEEMDTGMIHELGHSFGELDDEYIVISGKQSANSRSEKLPACSYFASTLDCQNYWKSLNFLGDGCEKEDQIDCTTADGLYNIEVQCHEGCNIYTDDAYRPSFNSMMRFDHMSPHAFSPNNITQINSVLSRFTNLSFHLLPNRVFFHNISMIESLYDKYDLRTMGISLNMLAEEPEFASLRNDLLMQIEVKFNHGNYEIVDKKVSEGFFHFNKDVINESNKNDRQLVVIKNREGKILYIDTARFPLKASFDNNDEWVDDEGNQIHYPEFSEVIKDRTQGSFLLVLPYFGEDIVINFYQSGENIFESNINILN